MNDKGYKMKKNVLEVAFRTETGICIFGRWVPIYRTTDYQRHVDPLGYGTAHELQKPEKIDELDT